MPRLPHVFPTVFTTLLLQGAAAFAQAPAGETWPTRVVRITLPYSSGAGPAVFMRAMAEKLAQAWGQQVIVESRPGASGFIGIEAVKNAAPDGHELLIVSNAHLTINPALYRALPYDPQKDFVPLATLYRTPFFVTVRAEGPYASVPALIAAAKASPRGLTYGAPYVGSPGHLGAADLAFRVGAKMVLVPYKDQSQIYVSIANGELDWTLATLGSALPLRNAGRLKLLAIAARERSKSAPEVPTVAEAGGPADYVVDSWLALLAPRGLPQDRVRRINADVTHLLDDAAILERMRAFGFEPLASTPEQLAGLIRTDARTYGELVRRTGATAD